MGVFKGLKSLFHDTNKYYLCFFENEINYVTLGRMIRQLSTDHFPSFKEAAEIME